MRNAALLAILLAGCSADNGGQPARPRPGGPPISIDLHTINESFDRDLAAAEKKYVGKLIECEAGEASKWHKDRETWHVRVVPPFTDHPQAVGTISQASAAKAAQVTNVMTVTLRGVCAGRQRDASGRMLLVLDDCEIVRVSK